MEEDNMPLVIGKNAVKGQSGSFSRLLIAEQIDYASEAAIDVTSPIVIAENGDKTGGDFYRLQPLLNSATLAAEGTTIASEFLDGTAAQRKDAAGASDIGGALNLGLSGDGTALVLRMITQDKDPVWHIAGGTGKTLPSSVNVVANGELLKNTAGSATIASDLSAVKNPVRLLIVPSATATLAGSRGIVTITGTDHAGDEIIENVAFTTHNFMLPALTGLWYSTVTNVKSSGWAEASGKTYGISAKDESVEVLFRPQDEDLVCYWTIEESKGNVPNTYYGAIMQDMAMTIARDSLVGLECTFLGRKSRLYSNVAGGTVRSDASALEYASPDVFSGWQCNFTAENTDIPLSVTGLTFTINQNLEYTNVLGSHFQPSPPIRTSKRLVQVEATVLYSPQNNLSEYFRDNRVLPNCKLTFTQEGLGAYPYEFVIAMEEMQLTADPDPPVADRGLIPQTLTAKAIRSERFPVEYEISARYSKYNKVRVYS